MNSEEGVSELSVHGRWAKAGMGASARARKGDGPGGRRSAEGAIDGCRVSGTCGGSYISGVTAKPQWPMAGSSRESERKQTCVVGLECCRRPASHRERGCCKGLHMSAKMSQ